MREAVDTWGWEEPCPDHSGRHENQLAVATLLADSPYSRHRNAANLCGVSVREELFLPHYTEGETKDVIVPAISKPGLPAASSLSLHLRHLPVCPLWEQGPETPYAYPRALTKAQRVSGEWVPCPTAWAIIHVQPCSLPSVPKPPDSSKTLQGTILCLCPGNV